MNSSRGQVHPFFTSNTSENDKRGYYFRNSRFEVSLKSELLLELEDDEPNELFQYCKLDSYDSKLFDYNSPTRADSSKTIKTP